VPCGSTISANFSSPLSCASKSVTVKKRISGGFIALAVVLPILMILIMTLWILRWPVSISVQRINVEALARTGDTITIADLREQPPQPSPPDLTRQIKRLGEYPAARGGYSDVYTALWYRNAEVHQPTSNETDIPMTSHNKVAIKVLRLSSMNDDEVEKKNKVRMAHTMPCSLLA
jgi:hypothetical protein